MEEGETPHIHKNFLKKETKVYQTKTIEFPSKTKYFRKPKNSLNPGSTRIDGEGTSLFM